MLEGFKLFLEVNGEFLLQLILVEVVLMGLPLVLLYFVAVELFLLLVQCDFLLIVQSLIHVLVRKLI